MLNKINELELDLTHAIRDYWTTYSSFDTWQFWASLMTFIAPLIVFLLLVDRKKLFLVSFYGYSVHMLLSYLDAFMNRNNFWEYPYFMLPFLSSNLAIDASLIPVAYLLLYQYTINHHKNFYLYSFLLSIFFAFVYAGTLQWLGMFRLTNGMNNFYLFLVDYGLALVAYWLTSFFLFLQRKGT